MFDIYTYSGYNVDVTGGGTCVPKTCSNFPNQCGTFSDGCEGYITCSCPTGYTCSNGVCISGGTQPHIQVPWIYVAAGVGVAVVLAMLYNR
jgi:hypothetical protein